MPEHGNPKRDALNIDSASALFETCLENTLNTYATQHNANQKFEPF